MKQVTLAEAVAALASIASASGKLILGKPAGKDTPATKPTVELTLETENNGPLVMSLDQFDEIYKGMVRCWPTVKPLKEQLAEQVRQDTAAERQRVKDEAASKRKADIQAKIDEREKKKVEAEKVKTQKAADKKAKDEADAKAKADKEAKAKKEKEAKAKADKDAKAKKDKEAKAKETAAK